MSVDLNMNLQHLVQFGIADPINVEGQAKDSVVRLMANNQDAVPRFAREYVGRKSETFNNTRLSNEGHKLKILEIAKEFIAKAKNNVLGHVDEKIDKLNVKMEITDPDESNADTAKIVYLWQRLGAMDKMERFQTVNQAFADGNRLVILAVLQWESSLNEPFDPAVEKEWKRLYSERRDPERSLEFSTITEARAKLQRDIDYLIEGISLDSGLSGWETSEDLLNAANDAILESEKNRTRVATGEPARSIHAPNTAVTG